MCREVEDDCHLMVHTPAKGGVVLVPPTPIRSLSAERIVGHRQEATRRRRIHPSVGTRAGEGARGGAAFFCLELGHLARWLPVVTLTRCSAADKEEKE
jgi:hypothetical protein